MEKRGNVMTPEFRVSFPTLFVPQLNDLNGKMEFSVVALFPKGADLSALKAAAQAAVVEKWGADKAKWPTALKTPFRDQAERAKDGALPGGHEAGAIFMTLKSTQKPGVVDEQVNDVIDTSMIYAGCYGRATVRAYAYDLKGNRGVAFGLQNFQKTRDGDPLSGRTRATDDFEPVAGAATQGGGLSAFD